MDYKLLQAFARELLDFAYHHKIPFNLYWYSLNSRKVNPNNKIGYYDTQPSNVIFEHGCKAVIVFPRLAFNTLQAVINFHIPPTKQIAYREDYQSDDDIGFDVYQRVDQLKLFIEPDNKASKEFTVDQMLKRYEYWCNQQKKALDNHFPPLSNQQIAQTMADVLAGFKRVAAYLQAQSNPQAKLRIRRESGFRHRMIRVDLAGTQTKREGFSDLVLVFGTTMNLPKVDLPKPSNPTRKPRSDSVAARYKANPSGFKYYDTFGIFEVYDE
jgi:hypothetical protein